MGGRHHGGGGEIRRDPARESGLLAAGFFLALTDVEGFEIVAGSVLLVSAGFEEPKIAEINFLII